MTDYMAPTDTRQRQHEAQHQGQHQCHPRRALTRRAATVAGAAASAAIAWTFLTQVAGVDLAVTSGHTTRHIGLAAVVVTALIVGSVASGLLAWLERHSRHPYRNWRVTALVVFVLSLLGPLGGSTGSAIGALAALHTIVATILIIGLPRECAADHS
ncbi:MAG TPA: DUF6069 family protein [Micromonosporaceae bacterium]|jgi:hypothetical protein